jgi:hypothetical protein
MSRLAGASTLAAVDGSMGASIGEGSEGDSEQTVLIPLDPGQYPLL